MLYAALLVGQKTNIHKGLSKTFSLLMVEIGGRYALISVIDVDTQLMFGSGIRVAYNGRACCCAGIQ